MGGGRRRRGKPGWVYWLWLPLGLLLWLGSVLGLWENPVPGLFPAPSGELQGYAGRTYEEVGDGLSGFGREAPDWPPGLEVYAPLDELGRCGEAYAHLYPETMPTEERGAIGHVRPSGWHTVKYPGIVEGNYLYNRCHLIAYQLAGENDTVENLITGTRWFNVEGMLPWENLVAEYLREKGGSVFYRVRPDFHGEELVARGVYMEAYSPDDGGVSVNFHVYVYNVQPGIGIEYATGRSWAEAASGP